MFTARIPLTILLCLCCSAAGAQDLPEIGVGIVYEGPGADGIAPARLLDLTDKIIEETTALTRREFRVRFPVDKRIHGAWSLEGIHAAVDSLLADPDVQIVLTIGPLATNDVCRRGELPKPVIAPFALDVDTQELPAVRDERGRLSSGVRNLNYLIEPGGTRRDLELIVEIGGFGSVHVLIDHRFLEAIPEIPVHAAAFSAALGVEIVLVEVGQTAASALGRLPDDAEVVYVTPLNRLKPGELDLLVQGLIERRLPSYSMMGRPEVERGLMAGVRPATDYDRLARRIALSVQRTLLGEDPGTLPAELGQQDRLVINMATVRAIGFPMPWRTLLEGELIHNRPRDAGRPLSMDQAVREAIEANRELAARAREVAAGKQNIDLARSAFRPALDLSVDGTQIDSDRAAASFGSQAERTASGGLSVTQLIHSDPVRANLEIAKSLQDARELDWEAARLDLAAETATAFLDVLRAQTLESIERDNMELTRSNLEMARRRVAIGYSGPAEVYRWESRLATSKIDLIEGINQVEAARLALNRLMHRPLRRPFDANPPSLEDPSLLTGFGRLGLYLDSIQGIERFVEFMVREGRRNSVELAALDEAIAAQSRKSVAARRSFWSPDIFLQGSWQRRLAESGEGSTVPSVLPGGGADDESWSVALRALLPLYAGGERKSVLRQSNEELARLRLEREALDEAIELRIRNAMTRTGTTFPSIRLSREAAEAARKNLDLVTDAYSRGAVSIIDLLDAQNADRVASQAASNAEYDFLVDLIELQRAANSIGFFMSEEERERYFERLAEFYGTE